MPLSFTENVYRILRGVLRGRVTTYAALARAAGCPRAARAVGNAMHRNPYPSTSLKAGARTVPCHRVVCADGAVEGFARGTAAKVRMLRLEGVIVRNGRVDLSRFGYALSGRSR